MTKRSRSVDSVTRTTEHVLSSAVDFEQMFTHSTTTAAQGRPRVIQRLESSGPRFLNGHPVSSQHERACDVYSLITSYLVRFVDPQQHPQSSERHFSASSPVELSVEDHEPAAILASLSPPGQTAASPNIQHAESVPASIPGSYHTNAIATPGRFSVRGWYHLLPYNLATASVSIYNKYLQ